MSVGEICCLEFAKSRDEDKKQQFFFFLCHQKIHIHERFHIDDQSDRWNWKSTFVVVVFRLPQ